MNKPITTFSRQPKLVVRKAVGSAMNFVHVTVTATDLDVMGSGDSKSEHMAQTKATFEMIERFVFRNYGLESVSSSGWAAHWDLALARAKAENELIERDAVITSWLSKISPVVRSDLRIIGHVDGEGSILQFGYGEHFVVLGTIYKDPISKKRILLSCLEETDELAVEKLSAELERAKLLFNNLEALENSNQLKSHFEGFCSLPEDELDWVFQGGNGIHYDHDFRFEHTVYEVPLWNDETAYVVRAQSGELQELYWGAGGLASINRKRLRRFMTFPYRINRRLHPII